GADRLEISIEVRDDPEGMSASQPIEERGMGAKVREGRFNEASCHPVADCGVSNAEPAGHAAGEPRDGLLKGERSWDVSGEGVVHRVEDAVEVVGDGCHPFLSEEAADAGLPGHAVGVEGAAEVEEDRPRGGKPTPRRTTHDAAARHAPARGRSWSPSTGRAVRTRAPSYNSRAGR